MKEPRNPYKILGLNQEDKPSRSDIKEAYRIKAAKYHPDRNPGDKDSERKFKEITAAYQFLTNGKYHDMFEDYARQKGYENPLEHAFELFLQVWEKIKPGVHDVQTRGKEVFEYIADKTKDKMDGPASKKVSDFLKSDKIEKGSDRIFNSVDEGLARVGLSTGLKGKGQKIGKIFNRLGNYLNDSDDDHDDDHNAGDNANNSPDVENDKASQQDNNSAAPKQSKSRSRKSRKNDKGNGSGPS